MGISVSSTQTHQRILQKRALRKMKRYDSSGPNRQKSFKTPIAMQNQNKKFPNHETNLINQNKNFESLEIKLKTNNDKYGEYHQMQSPIDDPSQVLSKKDEARKISAGNLNPPLTVKHNNIVTHKVSEKSSMQEIDLTPIKYANQLQVNPISPKYFSEVESKKQIAQTSQQNNTLNNQPHANEQSAEISRSMDMMDAKKIQSAKKYIESSEYPHKGSLSNGVYQTKPNPKIETILSQGNYTPKIKVNRGQSKEFPEADNIKLKTDEDYLDEIKPSPIQINKTVGPLLKNNRMSNMGNRSSSSLVSEPLK